MKQLILIFIVLMPVKHNFGQTLPESQLIKRHSIKFDFFSPLRGSVGLSFEAGLNNFIALDIEVGFIGIKPDHINVYKNYNDYLGGYFTAAPRIYFKKDENLSNFRGAYFKPEILFNYFSYERQELLYNSRYETYEFSPLTGTDISLALIACSGIQWVLSDFLIFDTWFGIGYGANWINEENDLPIADQSNYSSNQYNKFSHRQIGPSKVLMDCGLSLGILFK